MFFFEQTFQTVLNGVSGAFGENEIAFDRTARECHASMFREPFSLARRRVGNEDRAFDQKRHACENDRPNWPGVLTKPTMLCCPQMRLAAGGSYESFNDVFATSVSRHSAFAPNNWRTSNVEPGVAN